MQVGGEAVEYTTSPQFTCITAVPIALSYYVGKYVKRNESIVYAYPSGGFSQKKVGDYFELHYSTVSGIIKNHKSKACPPFL